MSTYEREHGGNDHKREWTERDYEHKSGILGMNE